MPRSVAVAVALTLGSVGVPVLAFADPLPPRPSIPVGVGPVHNGTFVSFPLGDRVSARVNVGSGNLLLQTTDLVLPAADGTIALGATYNSLLVGSGISVGAFGPGWRARTGVDLKLIEAADGSVTFVSPDGVTGAFVKSGTTYVAPGELKASLVKTDGSGGVGWRITEHETGRQLQFTPGGRLKSIKDRNANETQFLDSAGDPTKIASTRGTDGARRVAILTNASDRITAYQQVGDLGIGTRTAVYAYAGTGATSVLSKVTLPSGRTVEFGYDGSGNVTAVTMKNTAAATSGRTLITYDGSHRVTSVKRVLNLATNEGATTRFAYPSATQTLVAGPTTDQSLPVGSVPRTTYTVSSATKRVSAATDPLGRSRSATYTAFNDVASAANAAGTTSYGHSAGVNGGESLTSTSSPTGSGTSTSYGNPNTTMNPTAAYQPSGGTDGQGNAATVTYNGAGNMASSSNALAATASVTYNADGTAATSTDPGNGANDTNYGYSWKQLAFVNPVTGSTLGGRSLAYDGYGRLQTYTDGRNVVTTYSYDLDDRLTGVSFSGGTAAATTYGYDGNGNRTTRADATGTTSYGFDLLNRLTARTATSGGGTIGYGYDKAGNQTSVSDARGTSTATFDAANKQTSLTTAKGTVVRYAYDSSVRRTDSWFKSNADHSVWEAHSHTDYDAAGRPVRTWTATDSNDATGRIFDVGYCRSPFSKPGNPCNSTAYDTGLVQWAYDHLSSVRTDYTYDAGNRLTRVQVGTTKTYTYGYDARGNRTSATATGVASQTRSFNAANQVTTAGYNYDAAGNLTADPTAGTVAYNGAGQMTSVTNGSTTRTYTYAGVTQDELISQTTGSGTVSYVYGSTDQYGRPLLTSLRRSGDATGTYLDHDVTGTPTVLTTTTGAEVFYALDGLGSPVALVRDDGTKVGAYSYDPYGTYTTTVATGDAAGINPYRYVAGGVYDRTTGWIKYGERWYDPATGRFTQQDSIERLGDLKQGNRYAYAADDPINNLDPTGRDLGDTLQCYGSIIELSSGAAMLWLGLAAEPATAGSSSLAVVGGVGLIGLGLSTVGACM